jgi:Cu2+-containing amine oxidase
MAARVEPRVIMPEGQRFAVSGRTVSWMGWDFHADINAIQGMHISNLRFQGERLAYELHSVEFSAVYSGVSTRKDIYYSDGGYEMGNCATTLREGLQCPHGSVFLYGLGYDDSYVWGNALALDQERPTMCVFEAPDNEALFQHAKEVYEGLPGSSLYVRNILTVGNYDYTQVRGMPADAGNISPRG